MSDALSVVLRHYEALNDRDFDTYAELLSDDVVATVNGSTIRGRGAMMTYVDGNVGELPTMRIEVEDVLVESPRLVVTRLRLVNTAEDADAPWHFEGSTHQIVQVLDGHITEIVSFYSPHAADRTATVRRPIRTEAARLLDEQATLRGLATVIAEGPAQSLLFEAVNAAVADVVAADVALLVRFERDDSVSLLAHSGASVGFAQRRPLDEVLRAVRDTNTPRWLGPDGRSAVAGFAPDGDAGDLLRSTVVVPITLAGTVWGASVAAWRRPEPFPDATESRMAKFTDLVAIALATSQDRLELQQYAADQAALRRVAEAAARDAPAADILDAVVAEAAGLVGIGFTTLLRFEPDGGTEVVALHDPPEGVTIGMRASGEGDGATQRVWRTGRAARVDRLAEAPGRWPQLAASRGFSSSAAAPIFGEDRVWGALVAAGVGPLPPGVEERLTSFARLAGTAISAAEARSGVRDLADEQAALRRVAELAAGGVEPQRILEAVVVETSGRLGGAETALMQYGSDGFATVVATHPQSDLRGVRVPLSGRSSTADVFRTGQPSRTDDYAHSDGADIARAHGVVATVSVPIMVGGMVWGSLTIASRDGPLPVGLEARIAKFAGLVGTAVSSAHAREGLRRLADEQAALRRVAELVARRVPQDELFTSVAVEASRLIDGLDATLLRRDAGASWTVVATHGGPAAVGSKLTLGDGDDGLLRRLVRTGRSARIDDYATVAGEVLARDQLGLRSAAAAPIFVESRLWGAIGVSSGDRSLPAGAEQRLAEFAELVTAALANAQARADVQQLADEQAALLRVAERVARGEAPEDVFAAVAAEASQLLDGEAMTLVRYDGEDALVVVAASGGPAPPGTRIAIEADTLPDVVRRHDRVTRIDDYTTERDAELARAYGLTAAVGAPITVDGVVWGMLTATSPTRPLPPRTETRLEQFANLVASAVGNAEYRAQLIASRARVLSTADETRRRIQRDLHDGAQQRLVQTVITLKLAREAFITGEHAEGRARLDEALTHAERATAALRDLVRGILPETLARRGLGPGVEFLAFDMPFPVAVDVEVPRLAPEIETTAYFVVAEALTNVVKHAKARRASVTASYDDGLLTIEVVDDGVGGATAEHGSGLTGLFDRVDARGGRLSIDSRAGQGTAIAVTLPAERVPAR